MKQVTKINPPPSSVANQQAFGVIKAKLDKMLATSKITEQNAYAVNRETDALLAWAKFDREVSAEQRQQANILKARVVLALSRLADNHPKERIITAAGKSVWSQGEIGWLSKTLGVKPSMANAMRVFAAATDDAREPALLGRLSWTTCLNRANLAKSIRTRHEIQDLLVRLNRLMRETNSAKFAAQLPPLERKAMRLSARNTLAWLEAFIDNCQSIREPDHDRDETAPLATSHPSRDSASSDLGSVG